MSNPIIEAAKGAFIFALGCTALLRGLIGMGLEDPFISAGLILGGVYCILAGIGDFIE